MISSGRWQVVTEDSCYLIDLDAKTATRQPIKEHASICRRDFQPLPLIELLACAEGLPMQMILQIRDDHRVHTHRVTTKVKEIIAVR